MATFWRFFCMLYFERAARSTFQTCILNIHWGHTMCGSMVNIQSPTAEIRRGKKKERRKKEENTGWKYIWTALLHRATINNGHYPLGHSRSFKDTDFGTNWKLIYDFLLVINTNLLLVHGQVIIIFVVSLCLSVCLLVQSFSQPSLIWFRSNLDICYTSGSSCVP